MFLILHHHKIGHQAYLFWRILAKRPMVQQFDVVFVIIAAISTISTISAISAISPPVLRTDAEDPPTEICLNDHLRGSWFGVEWEAMRVMGYGWNVDPCSEYVKGAIAPVVIELHGGSDKYFLKPYFTIFYNILQYFTIFYTVILPHQRNIYFSRFTSDLWHVYADWPLQ